MAKKKRGRDSRTGEGRAPKPIGLSGGRQVTPQGKTLNKKGKKERQ